MVGPALASTCLLGCSVPRLITPCAERLVSRASLYGHANTGRRTSARRVADASRLGEEVTVVARAPSEEFVLDASELGARIIEGNYRNESALRAAGVVGASAVVILEDDDVGNLHSALTTQEINPNVRIVLRVFDEGFGNKIRTLFRDCSVLSSTAIAAPAFVAAALHDAVEQRLEIGGRSCVVRRAKSDDPDVLLPLVRTVVESDPELFPTEGADLLCLAFDASPSRAAESGRSQGTDGRPHGRPKFWTSTDIAGSVLGRLYVDARLRWLVAILLLLGVASTGIFWLYSELDLVTAFYFMVTVITTTGFGDLRWVESSASLKLYSAFLMLVGTAALTVFYALITDAFVSARLIRTPTPILRRMHDHVIVCGLGNVGYTVVDAIHRSGTPVAAVEIAESDQFLATVRLWGCR
ncbi:MAG: NAD-binding protein [Chloroflexia bacterium]